MHHRHAVSTAVNAVACCRPLTLLSHTSTHRAVPAQQRVKANFDATVIREQTAGYLLQRVPLADIDFLDGQ